MQTTENIVRRGETGFEVTQVSETSTGFEPNPDPDLWDDLHGETAIRVVVPASPARITVGLSLACLGGTWALVSAVTTTLEPSIGAGWALVAGLALALVPLAIVAVRVDGGWKWVELESAWVGLILGFFLLPAILFPVGGYPEVALAGPEAQIAPETRTIPYWMAAVVIAPVLEELLYRKLILQALAPQIGAVAAVIVVSALFATFRVGPWSWFGMTAMGVLFGILVLWERSTAICIGMHAGFHVTSLYAGIRPWQQPLPLVDLSPVLLVVSVVAVPLIYWFALTTSCRVREKARSTQT